MQKGVIAISRTDTGEMALLARVVASGDGDRWNNNVDARDVPDRVQKAAQAPLATSDSDMASLAFALSILTAFAPFLRNTSLFVRLWVDELMLRLPWNTRISFLTGAI